MTTPALWIFKNCGQRLELLWEDGGEKGRWPGRYRMVAALPCLEPWQTH